MPKWEYRTHVVVFDKWDIRDQTRIAQQLNRPGAQGWECFQVLEAGPNTYRAFFRRPKAECGPKDVR